MSANSDAQGEALRTVVGEPRATDARIPIYHDFTCRQSELRILEALVRRALLPDSLSDEDRGHLVALDGSRENGSHQPLRSLAFVRGRSGMGKSRLLTEIRAVAMAQGVRVQEVFCHERQGIPFLPVLRVVKELLIQSGSRERLWHSYGYVLSRVFPELAAELGEPRALTELPGEDGKIQLFDALAGILAEMGRERPLLILIHDLHRSDPGTIDFLQFLARNVFLDDVAQRREVPEAAGESPDAENWKEIGNRVRQTRDYITAGLVDGGIIDIDGPATRLLVMANYLELDRDSEDSVQEPEEDQELRVVERIEESIREPYVSQVSLAALSEVDTGSLVAKTLGGDLPQETVARLHSVTGGNPLHAVEICRNLIEVGSVSDPADGTLAIDPDRLEDVLASEGASGQGVVARLIGRRTERLEPAQLLIVQALAAIRRPVQISFLEKLLGQPREDVRQALISLEGRDFVKVLPVDRAPLFFLNHEDYMRCVYKALESDDRRDLHLRIGKTLAGHDRAHEPVRAFEIYEHLRRSSSPRESVPYGLEASQYFARAYATDAAISIDMHLLGLLGSDEDRPRRLGLLSDVSRLELERGEYPAAKFHAKQLLEESDLPDERRLEVMLHLSEIYLLNGEPVKGLKILNRALKRCAGAIGGREQALISGRVARLRLARQDTKRAILAAMRGLKELEGVEDGDDVRIPLLETLADAHLSKGEMVAAIHHFQRLLELVERVGDEARMASVLSTLGRVYYDRGNYFRAARYLFRSLDVVRRLQDVRSLSRAYDALGKVYRNSGDHLRGLEYFNRSLRLRERIGDYEGLSPTLNSLGSLYAHMGNYYQAIRYFKRSVENSERFGNTQGIVRAFLHLSRAYFEIGELRQVDSLTKQILILSQEFNLSDLEGEGLRIQGNLLFLRGDRKGAERKYRKAIEIVSRRSKKNSEAAATLDLGALLAEKEEYEAALKLISKGQILAEEIQSTLLQARAYLLKGNVYRFLKGGSTDRASEAFRKGLELVSGEHHLPFMWELDYSIAKVFQANRQYPEAGESYRRAERILERIASTLPEDMKVVYHDDRRRKVFYEDLRRFEKEASGRAAASSPNELPGGHREERSWRGAPTPLLAPEEPVAGDGAKILEAVTRLGSSRGSASWAERFLAEARRLVPSPIGYLMRGEAGTEPRIVAECDMGPREDWAGEEHFPGAVGRATIRRGEVLSSSDSESAERFRELPGGARNKNRATLCLPLCFQGKAVGSLYLERPSLRNPFTAEDQVLLDRFIEVSLGQLLAVERVEELEHYRGSTVLTLTGFEAHLRRLAREYFEKKEPFGFLEVNSAAIEPLFGRDEGRLRELIASAGDDVLHVIRVGEGCLAFAYQGDVVEKLDERQSALRETLEAEGLEGSAEDGVSPGLRLQQILPDSMAASEEDMVIHLSAELQRRQGHFNIDAEIDRLTQGDLSLKEAKTALEKRYITAELLKSRGNITRAAESLGVHRPQLSNLIKKHNVRREDFE